MGWKERSKTEWAEERKTGKAQAAIWEEAGCTLLLVFPQRCTLWFAAKNIHHMTESHSQTHAQDGRGGERIRQTQRGSLGAQVHKRTKDGEKRKGSGAEEYNCSWPHAARCDGQHRERRKKTLQNIRPGRTEAQSIPRVRKTLNLVFKKHWTRSYQASLKPLIGAILRACLVRRQAAAVWEAACWWWAATEERKRPAVPSHSERWWSTYSPELTLTLTGCPTIQMTPYNTAGLVRWTKHDWMCVMERALHAVMKMQCVYV